MDSVGVKAVEETGGENQVVVPSTGEWQCPDRRYIGPL